MTTRAVNIRRERHDVYIGRYRKGDSGYFGNPFVIGRDGTREQVLERYKAWFRERIATDQTFRTQVIGLRGKALGCFCRPAACHGDVIAEWIDSQPDEP